MTDKNRIIKFYVKKKNTFLYNGLIGSIIQVIRFLLSGIGILAFGGKLKDKLDKKSRNKAETRKLKEDSKKIYQTKENILEEWRNYWMISGGTLGCKFLGTDIFCDVFVDNYNFIKYKEKINREKNFWVKKIYVVVLFLESGAFLLLILYCIFGVKSALASDEISNAFISLIQTITESGIIGMGLYMFAKVVAKWIDIAKYQETWIRHATHVYMIEEQMLLYLLEMAPYDTGERRKVFQKKAIEIWNANQEKFIDNMENKEKSLIEK